MTLDKIFNMIDKAEFHRAGKRTGKTSEMALGIGGLGLICAAIGTMGWSGALVGLVGFGFTSAIVMSALRQEIYEHCRKYKYAKEYIKSKEDLRGSLEDKGLKLLQNAKKMENFPFNGKVASGILNNEKVVVTQFEDGDCVHNYYLTKDVCYSKTVSKDGKLLAEYMKDRTVSYPTRNRYFIDCIGKEMVVAGIGSVFSSTAEDPKNRESWPLGLPKHVVRDPEIGEVFKMPGSAEDTFEKQGAVWAYMKNLLNTGADLQVQEKLQKDRDKKIPTSLPQKTNQPKRKGSLFNRDRSHQGRDLRR